MVSFMAKFELKFLDFIDSNEFLKVEKSGNLISVFACSKDTSTLIILDKSTAIKFAKTLRTEINKITESEVSNGWK